MEQDERERDKTPRDPDEMRLPGEDEPTEPLEAPVDEDEEGSATV